MIVSKAGGLSSAEILASNLNYIIYKPLPGQEENNARFLTTYCNATIAYNPSDINRIIAELCDKAGDNVQVKREYYGKPQASENISSFILNRLQKN